MVTIKDIAKVAGVSHMTVSRALNGSKSIKEETKEKIFKIAQEMDYKPNLIAKSLVNQKSYIIGLFFSSIGSGTSDSFLIDVIKGINIALPTEYSLTVHGIDELESYDINPRTYDGIIIMSQRDQDDEFIRHINSLKIPLVVLNRDLNDKSIVNVTSNDCEGVAEAIRYAIREKGHQRIGFICGDERFHSTHERLRGYTETLAAEGISLDQSLIQKGNYSIESGRLATIELLGLPQIPSMIYCSNDDMAIGALKACSAQGVAVPNQVAIVGFDDIPFAQYVTPALTTVHKPIVEISKVGVSQLMDLIYHKKVEKNRWLIDTRLVLRETL